MVMFPVPFVIPSAVADSTGNGFRCAKGPCTGYILISAVQLAQTKLAANVRPMGTFIGTTIPYNGKLSCFLLGISTCLFFSIASARFFIAQAA